MNKAKQKGTAFETAVARFLGEETGAWVERRALSGTNDKGDSVSYTHLTLPTKRIV